MNETVKKKKTTIPEELLWEIFSRLPIKSLLRLRCGCKQWRSLIDDPYLCNMRLARPTSSEEDALILTSRYGKGASLEFWKSAIHGEGASPMPIEVQFPKRVNYELQNSCDGLLCFSKDVEDNEAEEEEAFVCNPLKKNLRLILPPPMAKSPRPDLSSYGLGFDSSINKYKVVRVYVDDYDECEMGAEVCTLEARTSLWRKISSKTPSFLPSRPSVYAGGALHWLAMQWPPGFHKVISFDFEQEKFSNTLSQEEEESRFPGGRFELVDLRGYLGVCHHLGAEIEIWKLKDMEKKVWVRECKVLVLWIWEIGLGRGQIGVVGVIGEDEILLRLEWNLVSYNSKTKAVRVIYTLDEEPQFHILVGSLLG